jgi:type II secretion system protein H
MARTRSKSGFSLVEVMAVLFITGLISGIVVLSLPRQMPAHERAAADFTRATEGLAERAILTSRSHALTHSQGRWQFQRLQEGAWQDVDLQGGRSLLPEGMQLRVLTTQNLANEDGEMRFVFHPHGLASPAQLLLQSEQGEAVIEITADGGVSWRSP